MHLIRRGALFAEATQLVLDGAHTRAVLTAFEEGAKDDSGAPAAGLSGCPALPLALYDFLTNATLHPLPRSWAMGIRETHSDNASKL